MKGIEWIKLNTNMCEDETMRLIDSMECRDPAHYLWIRLLLQAGKVNDNGLIYLKKDVPYTKEMLSILFNRPLDTIEKVFEIFETFKMIKIYENNIIKICNWEKHQNIEGMKRVREGNRERVKNFRERKKKENEISKENSRSDKAHNKAIDENSNSSEINKNKNCNANVTLQKEKREEDKKNKKKNTDKKERRENKGEESTICNNESKSDFSDQHNIKAKSVSSPHEEINGQALEIISYLKNNNVNIKGVTLNWAVKALEVHQEKYIKMAFDEAVERNKLDINYINGILKNWIREGYPKTYEDMEFKNYPEKSKFRFINFEPRKYDYDTLEKKLLGWTEDS